MTSGKKPLHRHRKALLLSGIIGTTATFAGAAAASGPDGAGAPRDETTLTFPACEQVGGPVTTTAPTTAPTATAPTAPGTGSTTSTSAPTTTAPATTAPSTTAPSSTAPSSTAPSSTAPSTTATSVPSPSPSLSLADARFLRAADDMNRFEVRSAMLAADRADREDVRRFAARLVAEHTAQGRKLEALAASLGVEVGTTLDPTGQAAVDDLAKLDGAAFDRAFVDAQIDAHVMALSTFNAEAAGTGETCTRLLAARSLPVLADHLRQAYELRLSPPPTTAPTTTAPTTSSSTSSSTPSTTPSTTSTSPTSSSAPTTTTTSTSTSTTTAVPAR